jgi:elongation factor 2
MKQDFIRNLSIIAHIDSGKTTITDSLAARAGLMSEEDAGTKRFTDNRKDEKERGITIKSTGVSLELMHKDQRFAVNLIDSPGHIDFNSEVTTALRVTDGALCIVDAVEGVCVQTETVLRQALAEQVKIVLVINKLDRYFFEMHLDAETAYNNIRKIIEKVNVMICTYQNDEKEDVSLSPVKGNVLFSCALHSWGFGLRRFAEIYASKTGKSVEKMMSLLWGENYIDPSTGKMFTAPTIAGSSGATAQRTFNALIYQPLYDFCLSMTSSTSTTYEKTMTRFNLSREGLFELEKSGGKPLYKAVMKKAFPLADVLTEVIAEHLPSPVVAQRYRVKTLYEGPMDDDCARAIRNCDPKGPLMMFVSKLVPTKDGGRFYAFGRIFSGTVRPGQKVTVLGANYSHGSKVDVYTDVAIQGVIKLVGNRADSVVEMECGNTVALVGLDNYLCKSGTVTTSPLKDAYPIRTMKFSVSPVVQVAVDVKNSAHLPKLIEGLNRLVKTDGCLQYFHNSYGQHILAGVGELNIQICISDLREMMHGTEILVSKPVVPFRETITVESKICLSKSPNGHNRFYIQAEPMPAELVREIENGIAKPRDFNAFKKHLISAHGWSTAETKKLWACGPAEGGEPTNMLVDCTKGISYLAEVQDSIVSAFLAATRQSVLCEEPLTGVRFNLMDVKLHTDSIHRGIGQVEPAARRSMHACILTGSPRLVEPVFQLELTVPDRIVGKIYSCVPPRRCTIFSEEKIDGTPMVTMKGYLPVLESFGFTEYMRSETSGQASPQCTFDHWDVMSQDPLDEESKTHKLIVETRANKGISPDIPPLSRLLDKL